MTRRFLPLTAILLAITAVAAIAACGGGGASGPSASVYYTLYAPLCSSRLNVVLSIDNAVVATDSFVVNTAAPDRTTLGPFAAASGAHRIDARIVGGFVWPTASVSLTPGQAYTDTLNFYCS